MLVLEPSKDIGPPPGFGRVAVEPGIQTAEGHGGRCLVGKQGSRFCGDLALLLAADGIVLILAVKRDTTFSPRPAQEMT